MLVAGLTVCMTGLLSPFLLVSSLLKRLGYLLRGLEPLKLSKKSVTNNLELFVKESNRVFCSLWLLNDTVHVLCRHAVIFSNRCPIIIIADTCSLDYTEFMKKVPKTYDVYCIDLPTCGLNPVVCQNPNFDSKLCCETHLANIMSLLSPSVSTKFTVIGETYGASLITQSVTSGTIKLNKLNEIILINFLPRFPLAQLSINFKICFSHLILKSCWAPWLFSSFLYPGKDVLSQIRTAFQFITEKDQPDMRSVWASGFDLKQLLFLSEKIKITLVETTVPRASYATAFTTKSGVALKCNSYTLNPLDERNNSKSVLDFINLIDNT